MEICGCVYTKGFHYFRLQRNKLLRTVDLLESYKTLLYIGEMLATNPKIVSSSLNERESVGASSLPANTKLLATDQGDYNDYAGGARKAANNFQLVSADCGNAVVDARLPNLFTETFRPLHFKLMIICARSSTVAHLQIAHSDQFSNILQQPNNGDAAQRIAFLAPTALQQPV